ncbi:E3 ubiquitin-protein ligase TRIM39-like [Ambystoma mexicanum]|uniref:E3 ubiquitin-protein ligase TRIM39-like n=1 Tax=Ambystoma mexicanum TaxID=8296 RepID=UPI0037E8789A
MVGTKRRAHRPPGSCPIKKYARSETEVKQLQSLKEEATCSICLEYFKEPVLVDCGHNFCLSCITCCWKGLTSNFPCPQCREISPKNNLRPNRQLANVVEIARNLPLHMMKVQESNLCEEHDETLKLFCIDDKESICVICRESREHRRHAVLPITEAAQEFKEKLHRGLATLRLESQTILGLKTKEENETKDLELKFESQRKVVMYAFQDMQNFLEEEKCLLLTSLEKERTKCLKIVEKNLAELEEQHASLCKLIAEMEKKCLQPDVELLKDVQSILNRCKKVKIQEPESDLQEREKNLQSFNADLRNLILEFGERFPAEVELRWARSFTVDVILDPGTAHPILILSEDMKNVRSGARNQKLPKNPSRFKYYPFVLGAECFTSGRHYWEVEVGQKTRWIVGVCSDSVSRTTKSSLTPKDGYWAMFLVHGKSYGALTTPPTRITPKVIPRVVGVYLDYEAGRLTFYDVDARSRLFAFPSCSFTGTLRPFLCPDHNDGGKNNGALSLR